MKTFEGYFSDIHNIKGMDSLENINNDLNKKSNSDKNKSITIFSTENVFERTGGLLKLPSLKENQGLLIKKCNSVHTFGMKYSLDIVYLNRHLKVVKLVENMKPKRMSLCLRAKHTLEMLAGEINHLGIKEGMTLISKEKPYK